MGDFRSKMTKRIIDHEIHVRLLEAVELIQGFLEECGCTSSMYYDENDDVVMTTDIGYFNEGLHDLKEYLDDMTIITDNHKGSQWGKNARRRVTMKYAKFEDVEKAIVFSELIKDKTCGEVKKLLNSIPKFDTVDMQEWIRCKDRLPEDGTDCLVTCDDGYEREVYRAYYVNGAFFNAHGLPPIIAWQEVPKPYKG